MRQHDFRVYARGVSSPRKRLRLRRLPTARSNAAGSTCSATG
nr:hypothetical protein [Paraburkholderia atlantica]